MTFGFLWVFIFVVVVCFFWKTPFIYKSYSMKAEISLILNSIQCMKYTPWYTVGTQKILLVDWPVFFYFQIQLLKKASLSQVAIFLPQMSLWHVWNESDTPKPLILLIPKFWVCPPHSVEAHPFSVVIPLSSPPAFTSPEWVNSTLQHLYTCSVLMSPTALVQDIVLFLLAAHISP